MTAYWKGKKRSEETKKKISESQKGRTQPRGLVERRAESLRKTGKSRQSFNYEEWRRKLLERDENSCVRCGKQEEYLHCHHIKSWKLFPELRFDVENGETLCAACHLKEGRENKEIVKDIETRFKKGQVPWCAGIKTGLASWNRGFPQTEDVKKKISESKKGSIPWNKGIPMSDEVKKKVSEAKKGTPSPMKGKTHTDEANEKNRIAHLGKRNSPETQFKKGIRSSKETEFQKGLTPWNKGKKGIMVAWNKGKPHSEETKMKISAAKKKKSSSEQRS